jgi:hypothetical protein
MAVHVSERRKLGKWFTDVLGKSQCRSRGLKEIVYGMRLHEMDLELRGERGRLDMEEKSFQEEDLTDFAAADIG